MKGSKSFVVGLIAIMSSVVVFGGIGNPYSSSKVAVLTQGETIKVIFSADGPCKVQIFIVDDTGNKIFSETISEMNGFIRPYNFTELPYGDYQIVVNDNNGTWHEEKISYQEPGPGLIAHVTAIDPGERRYLLSIPALHEGGENYEVTIGIYNNYGDLLHKETVSLTDDLAKLYRIEDYNPKEPVVFEIRNGSGKPVYIRKE